MAGVDVLAWGFRLASNKKIVDKSVNIKVCPYQAMISNGLFQETIIFSEVFYN